MKRFKRKDLVEKVIFLILLLSALLACFPVVILLTGSVMGNGELERYLQPVISGQGQLSCWRLMPEFPTFSHYQKLLFYTPQFFVLFWNSIKITGAILIGQLLTGVPAAYAFAVYKGKGSGILLGLYVVLMMMPFGVTMLPAYLVLQRLSLLNTRGAVILPAVFSAFPVFLMYGGFRAIPLQLLEAARIDGAGEGLIFRKIGLPLGKSGILSALVLGYLEYWNMIEQPMAFLEDKSRWPLSLYLPEITLAQAGNAFCACVIMLIPAAFVFVWGQDYLEQGIIYSGLKE